MNTRNLACGLRLLDGSVCLSFEVVGVRKIMFMSWGSECLAVHLDIKNANQEQN